MVKPEQHLWKLFLYELVSREKDAEKLVIVKQEINRLFGNCGSHNVKQNWVPLYAMTTRKSAKQADRRL